MRDDKTPIAGDLLGQGEPGRPAVGRGPNAGGEFSQEDYHHPAAGWGAARSVGKVLVQSPELVAGTRAIQRMNHQNGGFCCPGGACRVTPRAPPWISARTAISTSRGRLTPKGSSGTSSPPIRGTERWGGPPS